MRGPWRGRLSPAARDGAAAARGRLRTVPACRHGRLRARKTRQREPGLWWGNGERQFVTTELANQEGSAEAAEYVHWLLTRIPAFLPQTEQQEKNPLV